LSMPPRSRPCTAIPNTFLSINSSKGCISTSIFCARAT